MTPPPGHLQVLIVEDDEVTLNTYARSLELQGYDVRTALTAESAWHEAEVHRPDAMIVDLRLPGVDGLELLRRLRASERYRHIPVAIVTGDYFLRETMPSELQQLGAIIAFKPLWLEDLMTLVERLLTNRPKDSA